MYSIDKNINISKPVGMGLSKTKTAKRGKCNKNQLRAIFIYILKCRNSCYIVDIQLYYQLSFMFSCFVLFFWKRCFNFADNIKSYKKNIYTWYSKEGLSLNNANSWWNTCVKLLLSGGTIHTQSAGQPPLCLCSLWRKVINVSEAVWWSTIVTPNDCCYQK